MDCKAPLRLSSHLSKTFRRIHHLSPETRTPPLRRAFTTILHPPFLQPPALRAPHLRPSLTSTSPLIRALPLAIRHASTNSPSAPSSTPSPTEPNKPAEIPDLRPQGPPQSVPAPEPDERGEVPAYELTFTCKPCLTRSTHRISKHGYHNGSVLITCPQCKSRHVISDHLQIFNETGKSLEQILQEKGQALKTGVLDPEKNVELWDDGSMVQRGAKEEGKGGNAGEKKAE